MIAVLILLKHTINLLLTDLWYVLGIHFNYFKLMFYAGNYN